MELVTKAIIEGMKGNYAYFRDLMDRRYGKPTQPIAHTGEIDIRAKIENLTGLIKKIAEK